MKHDPLSFGKSDRAGWYLRAQIKRRREARIAALAFGGLAVATAIGTGFAMAAGAEGLAALVGIFSAVFAVVAAVANSEA